MADNYHLLFGLSANTPQYEYRNIKHFLSVVNQELRIFTTEQSKSQYILFTGVNSEAFRRDFTDPIDSLVGFETYSITHELILVKMESRTHAEAYSYFNVLIIKKLIAMDLENDIRYFARAHVEGGNRTKRADQIHQPRRLPPHRNRNWPSLVLEVGYTEEQRKLESDIDWWITQSNGEVKSAVAISVNPRVREIIICQWYGNNPNPQQQVYRNVLSQAGQGAAIKTSNPNPLVIPFEHLFLRQPLGDDEQDVTFSIDDLEELAKQVWEVQFEE